MGTLTTQDRGIAEVVDALRRGGPLTKAQLKADTGLARSTVEQRLDALLATALVTAAGEDPSSGGRRPSRFAFNPSAGNLLTADISASGVRSAVCDLAGSIHAERYARVDVAEGPERVLAIVDAHFADLVRETGRQPADIRGIGVGVPGPVEFATGRVVAPPIMTGWDGYDIPAHFRATYQRPVLVDNDVNIMALGEQRTHHPDIPHLLLVKVGTGVGSGIVYGGEILRGAQGSAGDIGHIHIHVPEVTQGPECRCGNIGCVEAYAGGWALARNLRASGHHVDNVDDVVALIRAGQPEAVRCVRVNEPSAG